jgi:hypothetical protein
MISEKCPVCRTGPDWSGELRQLIVLLGYTNVNIGDDTQSLAAMAFLPQIDVFVDRDGFSVSPHPLLKNKEAITDKSIYFIGNAFWKENSTNWPPPPYLSPFFISVHLIKSMLTKEYSSVFEWFDDLPTRDTATSDGLVKLGREAFFSGCVTTTFNRAYSKQSRTDLYVIAISLEQRYWFNTFLPILPLLPGPNITMEQTIDHFRPEFGISRKSNPV